MQYEHVYVRQLMLWIKTRRKDEIEHLAVRELSEGRTHKRKCYCLTVQRSTPQTAYERKSYYSTPGRSQENDMDVYFFSL